MTGIESPGRRRGCDILEQLEIAGVRFEGCAQAEGRVAGQRDARSSARARPGPASGRRGRAARAARPGGSWVAAFERAQERRQEAHREAPGRAASRFRRSGAAGTASPPRTSPPGREAQPPRGLPEVLQPRSPPPRRIRCAAPSPPADAACAGSSRNADALVARLRSGRRSSLIVSRAGRNSYCTKPCGMPSRIALVRDLRARARRPAPSAGRPAIGRADDRTTAAISPRRAVARRAGPSPGWGRASRRIASTMASRSLVATSSAAYPGPGGRGASRTAVDQSAARIAGALGSPARCAVTAAVRFPPAESPPTASRFGSPP